MKTVEDAFASATFRRVVLPGIVMAAGVHPLLSRWTPAIERLYGIGPTVFIIAEVIVLGLAVSSTLQWIYYVYEGFRLEWLTALAGRLNRRTLASQQRRWSEVQGDRDFDELSPTEQAEVIKITEYLRDFPERRCPDGSMEYFVERPTRLGNIIATYETYAESRYGVDGLDFWHHLLNLAPDASRKSFDENYAFAESLVLASFAGALVAIIHLLVLVGFAIGALARFGVELATGPSASAGLILAGVAVWWLFYQAALPAHRGAGDALRAIIDAVMPKFMEWATNVRVPPPDEAIERVAALNRYLATPDRGPANDSE